MTIKRFSSEREARSYAASILKGEREVVVTEASPVKFKVSEVSAALARRDKVVARFKAKF